MVGEARPVTPRGKVIGWRLPTLVAVILLAAPAQGHQSSDHGTLDVRSTPTDIAAGDVPHLVCDVYIGGNGMDGINGSLVPVQDPRIQSAIDWPLIQYEWDTRIDWNETEEVESGGSGAEPVSVDFVRGNISALPPGYYEWTAYVGDLHDNHSTPSIDFVIDGPCGEPVVPCPSGFTAVAQEDGSVLLSWIEQGESNGTHILRDVGQDNDFDFLGRTASGANGYLDTTTYAGATFHYFLILTSSWTPCGEPVTVTVPGERTHFPCPASFDLMTFNEGVYVSWEEVDGADESAVYRADGEGEFQLVGLAPGPDELAWFDDTVIEGEPYTYQVTPRFDGIEATGCPMRSMAAGWEFDPECCFDTSPPTSPGDDETAEVPDFPSWGAAVVALAAGAIGYAWIRRRNG
jgi:hypothetical protein